MRILLPLLFILFFCSISEAQDFWQIASGPQDGDVMALASDSAGTIYATSMSWGVHPFYQSTDGGRTWTERTSVGVVIAMAVNDQGHLYALRRTNSVDTLGNGIWRTTNGGQTWDSILLRSNVGRAIAVDPDGGIFFANDRNLRYSSNDGSSWIDVRIRKDDFLHVANQVQALAISPLGEILAGTAAGLYRSSDRGATWSLLTSASTQLNVQTVGVASDVILAGTDSALYRSSDNGASWTKTTLVGRGPISILLHPGGDIFASTFGSSIYRSTDRGNSWTRTEVKGLVTRALLATSQGDLLASSSIHGMYRSTNNGTSWENSSRGMTNSTVHSVVVAPNGRIFAGLYGRYSGFIYSTTDRGESWQGVRPDSVPKAIWCMAALDNGYILAGTEGTGIYRSTDDGETWEKHTKGLRNLFVRSFAIKPNGDILAGTENGLHISTDQGATWNPTIPDFGQIWSLAVYPERTVAGFAGGSIRYSNDDGATWSRAVKVTETDIQALAIHGDGSLYAASFTNGVFRSIDSAKSWTRILDEEANNMALLVGTYGEIYLGGSRGVRRSTDAGQTWDSLYGGLGRRAFVSTLARDSAGYLYAGTSDRGFARSIQKVAAGVETRANTASSIIRLDQNSPNPVTSETTITFAVERAGHVHLYVYDLFGNRVAEPVDKVVLPGEHEVHLDCTGLQPGTYYYELRMDTRSAMRKFVLAR